MDDSKTPHPSDGKRRKNKRPDDGPTLPGLGVNPSDAAPSFSEITPSAPAHEIKKISDVPLKPTNGHSRKNLPPIPEKGKRPALLKGLWSLFAAFLVLAVLGLWYLKRQKIPATFSLAPVKGEFYHDDFVDWTLTAAAPDLKKQLKKMKLTAWVEKNGQPIVTVGRIEKLTMRYDATADVWRGRWPVPWNAPDGEYAIRVDTTSFPPEFPKLYQRPFKIVSRAFDPVPAGWGILTLEDMNNLDRITGPDGVKKDASSLVDWAEWIGADAIVIQGGESGGYDKKLKDEFPWFTQPDRIIKKLGDAAHEKGMKLGVYAMCFLIGGPAENSPNYKYGWDYREGEVVNGLDMKTRRGVSILDEKRPKDIAKVLKRWHDMDEVDFVGLDYIRPVFGGYELASDFVRDMPTIEPPAGWAKMDEKARMLWLAKARILRPTLDMATDKNYAFIDKWFWYRAHRNAKMVRNFMAELKPKKPVWAFTLSWEKGWQHGQDPVMLRDAGVDIDSIMLYEADKVQFGALVRQWNRYVRQSQVNLTVGDVIDWPLHQRTLNPAGPEDFYNRNMKAIREFHTDGPVRGLFIHDFNRARRGRLGPYSMREWLLASAACLTSLREAHRKIDVPLSLNVPERVKPGGTGTAYVAVAGNAPGAPIKLEVYSSGDVEASPAELTLSGENASAAINLRYVPNDKSAARGHRSFVAVRRPPEGKRRAQVYVKYFGGATPADETEPSEIEPSPEDPDAPPEPAPEMPETPPSDAAPSQSSGTSAPRSGDDPDRDPLDAK